jgi:transposase
MGMYLRHSIRRKDGKTHTHWRLVRSVRCGRKVRQETVAQLGELTKAGRRRAHTLAQSFGGRQETPGLFDAPLEKEVVEIRLNGVRMERVRRFGDVWVGQKLWRMTKLDEFFEKAIPLGKEDICWGEMAELMTIARLCEPSSDLHVAEDWLRKTALADMLGVAESSINDDRLYRALDALLPTKAALEDHLKSLWTGLFGAGCDLLLYDITSTYFEGQMESNPEARRGHSRDHRSDCKQVCIGLVVTREGLPLGYEVFPGNTADSTTVREVVETLERRYGKLGRVWVMDRGMVSESTMTWMRENDRRYVVGTPKSEIRKHEGLLREEVGWKTLSNGVDVRWGAPGETGERYLICRSEERRAKESAMHDLFEKRIESALERLNRRLERAKKAVDRSMVERQVGRLLQRNQRSGRLFCVAFEEKADHPSGIRLTWTKDEMERERRRLREGCYVLQTDGGDWTEEAAWTTYIQLTQAEAAFRIQKSDLSIRPVWHQKPERVRAHIFVCFLGYVLWKVMEQWQSRAGLGNSPRTILEELGQIQSGDVVLPTMTGEVLRLRCIARPEKAQRMILQRLGIDLPRRMKVFENVVPTF